MDLLVELTVRHPIALVIPRMVLFVLVIVIFVPEAATVEKLFVELESVMFPPVPEPELVMLAKPSTEDGPDCEMAPLAVTVRLFAVIVPRTKASGRPGSCPAPSVWMITLPAVVAFTVPVRFKLLAVRVIRPPLE